MHFDCAYARLRAVTLLGVLLFFMPLPAAASFTMSVAPLRAICLEIASRAEDCELLLRPGVSPHTYEPRPQDVRALSRTKALFFVSPLLDGWASKLPISKRFAVIEWLPKDFQLTLMHADGHDHGFHDKHQGVSVDPHFWLDPLAVQAILPRFVAAFCEQEPVACKSYQAKATRFAAELANLNTEIATLLNPVKGAALLVYHPFLGYFVNRYGFRQVAAIEPSPGKEPTPRFLKDTVALVKKSKAKIIVVSPEIQPRAVNTVAEAAGLKVIVMDDLGGVAERERYADLMRHNARVILEALR